MIHKDHPTPAEAVRHPHMFTNQRSWKGPQPSEPKLTDDPEPQKPLQAPDLNRLTLTEAGEGEMANLPGCKDRAVQPGLDLGIWVQVMPAAEDAWTSVFSVPSEAHGPPLRRGSWHLGQLLTHKWGSALPKGHWPDLLPPAAHRAPEACRHVPQGSPSQRKRETARLPCGPRVMAPQAQHTAHHHQHGLAHAVHEGALKSVKPE